MGQVVRIVHNTQAAGLSHETPDSGIQCEMPGSAVTVSAIALRTGGIRPGGLVETDRG
ncbi:MAG: hypothetical protein HDS84_01355 [Bacteroidales bacterium]|nr:hypothetical protein [Bacteroidales bacterium]